jgi:hypothetical protein
MDRRAFLTKALISAGCAALSAGAAEAVPILVPSHEAIAPESNVEKSYWVWRRPWRRRYYYYHPYRRYWRRRWGWRRRYW